MAYSGLTPTTVLRYLNRMLGTLVQEVEIDQEGLMRIVYQETLQTYSKFFPYLYKVRLTHRDLIEGKTSSYRQPRSEILEINGIGRVWVSNLTRYGSTMVPLTMNPFAGQIFEDAMSMTLTPQTFRYEPPYTLDIYPRLVGKTEATVEVKAVHPYHLKTIHISMRDEFLRMALLDVLVSLYPIRHRFENLTTPYGQIMPFFDMVDRAGEEREQLIEQWRSKALRTGTRQKIFVI